MDNEQFPQMGFESVTVAQLRRMNDEEKWNHLAKIHDASIDNLDTFRRWADKKDLAWHPLMKRIRDRATTTLAELRKMATSSSVAPNFEDFEKAVALGNDLLAYGRSEFAGAGRKLPD